MLLTVDVGNTQTVIGLFGTPVGPAVAADGERGLIDHWRMATNHERTGDEHYLFISDFLRQHGASLESDVTGLAIASVVPRLTTALREMARRHLTIEPMVLGPGVRTGMPILYDNPKEVGADRIANAVAAYERYGGPAIVVDFGTATTLDAITDRGEYAGGAIVPGVEIGLDALFDRADRLTRVELVEPRWVIGKTTVESVQSGVIYGTVALVDGLCRRFEEELGDSAIVSTGGLGEMFSLLSASIQHHDPWLTLHGLQLIHDKNA